MKLFSLSPFFSLSVLAFILLFSPMVLVADEATGMQDDTPSLEDSLYLDAFMDGIMQAHMDNQHIAGATVAILHEGDTALFKGYGYADLANEVKVDPDTTLFRIGSISKLFTWIAVLQQVEKGHLDLDRDINDYLSDIRIPETYDKPVTLRSLMSHTPGFEDILLRLFIREDQPVPALKEIFQNQMPRRIMPPMEEAAYSNHGTGLAQYIVEQTTGKPFEQYVEQHILEPLGMTRTTFRQPLPEELRPDVSNGYAYEDGIFQVKPFEVVPMAGAGGASTTASDMLVFMECLLNEARHDTISLLDSATYATMKEPVLTHTKGMNPARHGFMDLSKEHITIIGHGGNTFLFHSLLALLPEHDTAIFISFNTDTAGRSYHKVLELFLEQYFPPPPAPDPLSLDMEYLEGFTGTYMSNRRPHSDILKIIGLMNTLEVSADNDQLRFKDFFGDVHYPVPIDSTTFYLEKTHTKIGFQRPADENAQKLYISNYPIMAFNRIEGLYSPGLHLTLFVVTLICILYILLFWPWAYFLKRHYEKNPKAPHTLPFIVKLTAWIPAALFLLFYILLFISAGGEEIVFGIPAGIRIGLFLPLAAIPFVLMMIWSSIVIWKSPGIRLLSRIFYNLACLAFLLSYWQLYFWNLLGWNY
ncbi:MAG: serine hydrolase domain-containing protein [Bacteroidales bacterium]